MARIKWKKNALYNLRRAPGVIAHLEQRADSVADTANKGAKTHDHDAKYATSSQQGERKPQGRWRTTVITANAEAMVDNASHNRLLSALMEEKGK